MKLNRLIYRSTADKEFLEGRNFTDLLSKCNENNKSKGINGLLLLSGGQFLQVLPNETLHIKCVVGSIPTFPKKRKFFLILDSLLVVC